VGWQVEVEMLLATKWELLERAGPDGDTQVLNREHYNQHSLNILGTFSQHAGNIQSTFTEHMGNIH
jgi:hypothetical protein